MSPYPFPFGLLNGRSDQDNDPSGQLLLNVEDLGDLTVILLGPQVSACRGVDQLSGEPETTPSATRASLENVADSQLLRNGPNVDRASL